MAAVTAAVVVAGAAVAASAYSASQAGKGGPDSLAEAGYVGPGQQERMFNRGTRDILNSERAILDDAVAQGKLIEPAMYEALGVKPVYDRPEDPEIGNLSSALAGKQQELAQLQQKKAQIQAGKAAGGMRGGKGTGGHKRTKIVKQLSKQQTLLSREIASMSSDLEQRSAVGRRVVGFEPIPGVADPTGSTGNAFGGALNQFNAHLSNALAGKEPLDPTLKSSFDEKERTLRERLRRQMGPDYESSTAGANALANFDRERAESFTRYNTEAIGYYSGLAESRAGSLSSLTSNRIKNLALPSTIRAGLGSALGATTKNRVNYAQQGMAERAGEGDARRRLQAAEDQRDAERTAAYTDLIQSAGGAAGSAGGTFGSYLNSGSALATPDTVSVPQYNTTSALAGGAGVVTSEKQKNLLGQG